MKKRERQPLQPDRLDGEEVDGKQVVTLEAHKFAPGHPASRARHPVRRWRAMPQTRKPF